jgi:cardiolipin synthase
MTTTIGRAALVLSATLLGLAACNAPSTPGRLEKDEVPTSTEACKGCPDDDDLARAAQTPEQLEFVRRVNKLEYALTGRPLVSGNQADLLLDGPQTHNAQLAEIRKARHHVHLITYIMTDGVLANDYLDALVERRKHGVIVRLMFDSVGGRTVGKEYLAQLAKAGIEVREYGAVNPVKSKGKDWSLTRRHHRKILVVDGKVAFTGGINISDEYRESSASAGKGSGDKKAGTKGADAGGWRDTHVRVVGPAVAQFQKLFFESWEQGKGGRIAPGDEYWPKLRREGNELVRAVTQQGNDLHQIALQPVEELTQTEQEKSREQAIYASYLVAIRNARQRIWITQAYFIPNDEFINALGDAARRGVDVRLLVPSTSDIEMMVHASRFHYQPVLESGARIWEFTGPMLHSKTAVVDGVWATVGSSNLDYRSFIHNDEANAIIIGHEFGAKMEAMYRDDLAKAREITRKAWEQRSWSERFNQRMAVMLKYWI